MLSESPSWSAGRCGRWGAAERARTAQLLRRGGMQRSGERALQDVPLAGRKWTRACAGRPGRCSVCPRAAGCRMKNALAGDASRVFSMPFGDEGLNETGNKVQLHAHVAAESATRREGGTVESGRARTPCSSDAPPVIAPPSGSVHATHLAARGRKGTDARVCAHARRACQSASSCRRV